MGLLAANGAVGFTDGVKAVADALVMRRVLAYARSFDQLVIQHPEEPSLARRRRGHRGRDRHPARPAGDHAGRPKSSWSSAICASSRSPARAITSRMSRPRRRSRRSARAKARGLPVTCDTAPPYFALNETAIGDYRTFAKLSPPLRSEADRRAVVEGLRDGTIDAIASDHAPWDQDSKRLPFSSAACGIVGLETLLPLSLELYHNRHSSLIEVLRRLTLEPGRAFSGSPVGRLAAGAPADLVLFDPDVPWRIATDAFRSKSKNAPFDGRPVQGRVVRTIVDGRTIFRARAECRRAPLTQLATEFSSPAVRRGLSAASNSPSPAPRESEGPRRTREGEGMHGRRCRGPRLSARLDPVRAAADPARRATATSGGSARAISARPMSCAPAARGWRR